MPKIQLPDEPGGRTARALSLCPPYAHAWDVCAEATFVNSILPWRITEAVRYRTAQINGCLVCQSGRWERGDEEGFTEEVYGEIETFRTSPHFTDAEKLAIEFAEKFALDHESLDEAFFDRLHSFFSDPEIVDLTFLTARHMAFGRFTHVLGLDDHCDLTSRTSADAYITALNERKVLIDGT